MVMLGAMLTGSGDVGMGRSLGKQYPSSHDQSTSCKLENLFYRMKSDVQERSLKNIVDKKT